MNSLYYYPCVFGETLPSHSPLLRVRGLIQPYLSCRKMRNFQNNTYIPLMNYELGAYLSMSREITSLTLQMKANSANTL